MRSRVSEDKRCLVRQTLLDIQFLEKFRVPQISGLDVIKKFRRKLFADVPL
jgi:hypothetical protein